MLNIAVSSMINLPGDMFDFLTEVGNSKFQWVEIRMEKKHWNYDDPENILNINQLTQENTVKILSYHAPMDTVLTSDSEYHRVKSIREVEKGILIAHRTSAKYVVIHGDGHIDLDECSKKKNLEKSLMELVEYARRWEIKLLLENLFPPRINSSPEELYELSTKINSEYLGICLDLGHLSISGFPLPAEHDEFWNKVYSIHLNDNEHGVYDQHLLPGQGRSWKQQSEHLNFYGKRGIFMVLEVNSEIHRQHNWSPDQNLTKLQKNLFLCEQWRRTYLG
ncbi:MAG: hypothetical protein APR63_01970 [Desulfuromonas sp. SDB]|nr:MAG: hypothetical protein APR63_01970 [Desulfuromonas sp. SDB]